MEITDLKVRVMLFFFTQAPRVLEPNHWLPLTRPYETLNFLRGVRGRGGSLTIAMNDSFSEDQGLANNPFEETASDESFFCRGGVGCFAVKQGMGVSGP